MQRGFPFEKLVVDLTSLLVYFSLSKGGTTPHTCRRENIFLCKIINLLCAVFFFLKKKQVAINLCKSVQLISFVRGIFFCRGCKTTDSGYKWNYFPPPFRKGRAPPHRASGKFSFSLRGGFLNSFKVVPRPTGGRRKNFCFFKKTVIWFLFWKGGTATNEWTSIFIFSSFPIGILLISLLRRQFFKKLSADLPLSSCNYYFFFKKINNEEIKINKIPDKDMVIFVLIITTNPFIYFT